MYLIYTTCQVWGLYVHESISAVNTIDISVASESLLINQFIGSLVRDPPYWLGMVLHAYNLSPWDAEAGGILWLWDQSGLWRDTPSKTSSRQQQMRRTLRRSVLYDFSVTECNRNFWCRLASEFWFSFVCFVSSVFQNKRVERTFWWE